MKYILIAAAILMTGCDSRSNAEQAVFYSEYGQHWMDRIGEVCKNGVVYYFATYDRSAMLTPAFKPDSTVKTCN